MVHVGRGARRGHHIFRREVRPAPRHALPALAPDPLRLNREQFLAATPSATHAGVLACQPGSVALLRKGMKLTRERYSTCAPRPRDTDSAKELARWNARW